MKKFFFISALFVLVSLFFFSSAIAQRVFDEANILSAEEEEKIENEIIEFQKDTAIDFAFLSTQKPITSQRDYADSFYDSKSFGYGKDNSGILYFVDMYNRIPYLCTTGIAIDFMTDARIANAHEICFEDLKNGNYYEAIQKMIVVLKAYIYDGIPFGRYTYFKKD